MKPRTTAADKFSVLKEKPNREASPELLYSAGLSMAMRLGVNSLGIARRKLPLAELADYFLESWTGMESYVKAIVKGLGPHSIVEDLELSDLQRWISGCHHLSASTRNYLVEVLAMIIRAGLVNGLLLYNPLRGTKEHLLATVRPKERPILTVEQAEKIIRVAQYRRDVANAVALRLFGGLCVSQAAGMLLEDVTTAIRVPGTLTLGGHEWEIHCPPNLKAWLALDGRQAGPVTGLCGKSLGRLILGVFRKAGVRHRPHLMDSTWASYRRAVVGDVAKVFAGRHFVSVSYPGAQVVVVPKAEGERYFGIYP